MKENSLQQTFLFEYNRKSERDEKARKREGKNRGKVSLFLNGIHLRS
jgi:hypothetical protein